MLALWPWLIRVALLAVAYVAAATDIRRRLIPNWLTLPALALGLAVFGLRDGPHGLLYALGGAAIPAAVFGLPWLLGGLGGGDFKMAVAIGALGGPLFSLAALVWEMVWGVVLFAWWAALRGRRGVGEPAPFGVALSGGVIAAVAASVWGTEGARVALVFAAAGVIGAGVYGTLTWSRHRQRPVPVEPTAPPTPPHLRDERGQALLFAILLIVGALLVTVVGGLGVAEDVVYHSALQTAADAAAMGAAKTATTTGAWAVDYRVQSCRTTRHWSGRAWEVRTTCSEGPTATTTVSGPSSTLLAPTTGLGGAPIPTLAAAAGCDAYRTAPSNESAVVCLGWAPVGSPRWAFPNPTEAENAAIALLQQREPRAVLTSFQLAADGSGQVYLTAKLTEPANPASVLFGPIETQVHSVGMPTVPGS